MITTRCRRALAALATTAAIGATTGIGTAAGGTAATGDTTTAGGPIVVSHALGTVVLDAAPTRVVALGLAEADTALALGVELVALPANPFAVELLYPWQQELVDLEVTAPVDVLTTAVNFEQIAAFEPDVILAATHYTIDADYAALSAIAPTLAYQESPFTDSWQTTATATAAVLGRDADVAALINEIDADVAGINERLTAAGSPTATFAVAQTSATFGVLVAEEDFGNLILRDLGFGRPDVLDTFELSAHNPGVADISLEQIDTIDSDAVFVAYVVPGTQAEVEAHPLFAAVPAVAAGGYVALDAADAIAVRTPTPLTVRYTIERLTPLVEHLTASAI